VNSSVTFPKHFSPIICYNLIFEISEFYSIKEKIWVNNLDSNKPHIYLIYLRLLRA